MPSSSVSKNYKIIQNPDLKELKKKYQNAWKDICIPKKQLSLVKESIEHADDIPTTRSAIDLLKIIEDKNVEQKILEVGCSTGHYGEIFKNINSKDKWDMER